MGKEKRVLCPIWSNKIRIKARPNTLPENFPLVCPKSVVKAVSVVVALLVDAFAVFLVRYGWMVSSRMLTQGQASPMLGLPTGMVYLLIPVGVALMAIFYTIHTFENLKDKPEDKEANA